MTWPAALPTAAVRVLRTAAGRRALQVVLLVGGLFTLGFLCGEQAHAADGAPMVTSSTASTPSIPSIPSTPSVGSRSDTAGAVERSVGVPDRPGMREEPTVPDEPTVPPASSPKVPTAQGDRDGNDGNYDNTAGDGSSKAPDPIGEQVLRPVTDHVVPGIDAHVVQPVGDVVQAVNDGLADAQTKLPPLSSLPGSPTLPALPSLPTMPSLPGQTLPAPGTGTPRPGSTAPSATDRRDGEERSGAAPTGVHGPQSPAGAAGTGAPGGASHSPAHPGGHRVAPAGQVPAHQAPADQPGGTLSTGIAADNGTSRHGDAHAVSLNHRAPLRLLPGAAARVAADGPRDRHRDIPVSPA